MKRSIVGAVLVLVSACEPLDPGPGAGGGGGSLGGGGGPLGGGSGGGSGVCSGVEVISADTTWNGARSVTCNTLVGQNATLTIAAGSTLTFSPGITFEVQGSLRVEGTAASPVVMTGAAVWGPVLLSPAGAGRTLSLKNLTIRGAGEAAATPSAPYLGAGLAVDSPEASLLVEQVTVEGASGIGVVLRRGVFAPGSVGLTVRNAGSYALFVRQGALGTIPTGSYAANGRQGVLVGSAWSTRFAEGNRVTTDGLVRKLDVPYVFGTGTYKTDLVLSTVESGPPTFGTVPLLTLEAGVELRFSKVTTQALQSLINIDSAPDPGGTWRPLGALRAVGTAAAPIVFTSAEAVPAPGDWATIALEELDPRTLLDHVVIAYAGADARALSACLTNSPTAGGGSDKDGDAALQLFLHGTSGPGRSPIVNSTLRDSAGGGIYRAWSGTDFDLTATNTFTNIAWCRQTPIVVTTTCVPSACN